MRWFWSNAQGVGTVLGCGALVLACCKQQEAATKDSPGQVKTVRPVATQTATAATPQLTLTAPATQPPPTPTVAEGGYQANGFPNAMPKDRSAAPTVKEWSAAPRVSTKKLPDGCMMKFVREWLKINCSKDTDTLVPMAITNISGMGSSGADYFSFAKSGAVTEIVVRTIDGKKGTANFVTDRGTFLVGYDWPYKAPFPSTIFQ